MAAAADQQATPVLAQEGLGGRPKLENDRLVRAARGEVTDVVPVWAMRQAGRYLPEFREIRKEHEFFSVCNDPELASEVTVQPLRRFPTLDAVVIFSDILIVPQAMGMECIMQPGKGPVFPQPLRDPAQLEDGSLSMAPAADEAFAPLYAAIAATRRKMQDRVPVVGFCGAPWTLMSYMIEGGGSKTHAISKAWLFNHPEASTRLLTALADLCIELLVGQWNAGASVLQVFDSSAGELTPDLFRTFALPALKRIADGVRARLGTAPDGGPPMIVFARLAHYALEWIAEETSYDVVGLDWTIDPRMAKERVPACKAFQGNLDPCALYGSEEVIRAETRKMLARFGARPLIANLGWGMHPTHDPEKLGAYIDAVHDISAELRPGQIEAAPAPAAAPAEAPATTSWLLAGLDWRALALGLGLGAAAAALAMRRRP